MLWGGAAAYQKVNAASILPAPVVLWPTALVLALRSLTLASSSLLLLQSAPAVNEAPVMARSYNKYVGGPTVAQSRG